MSNGRRWAPQCKIIYDKFHILQHANDAIEEVRRAEFFRQGKEMRGLIKGKNWLLMSRWKNQNVQHRGELNRLFQMSRRVFKAYMLKESLEGSGITAMKVRCSTTCTSGSAN